MDQTPSLRPGLLRHRLDNELLVYDTNAEQIHLLNPTTFAVVEMLEEGVDPAMMASRLGAQNHTDAGAEILALALDELAKAKLLEMKVENSSTIIPDGNRRQMIQRAATLGAALLIPAIVTLTPKAASAATNLANGSPCVQSTECLSGCCGKNSSGSCQSNVCSPTPACGNCNVP
jgi:hypothetical protein